MADFERTTKILEEYSKAVLDEYIHILQAKKKPASGELINSASFSVTANGTQFICYLNLAEHWKYVEGGRKGKTGEHFKTSSVLKHYCEENGIPLQGGNVSKPPYDAIRDWLDIKPVKPYALKNGEIPTLDQLAYMIQNSIYQKGIKPLPAVEQAWLKVLPKYKDKIKVAILQDLTK